MNLKVLVGPDALNWKMEPGQGMVVVSVEGKSYFGYKFDNRTLDQQVIQAIASDAQERGTVKSVKSCAGYSGGTVSISTIMVSLDESVFGAVVRSLHNLQRDIDAVAKGEGWVACKGEILQNPYVELYIRLKEHMDLHLVRSFADLPDALIEKIKKSCPTKIYRQGINAILKYYEPVPIPSTSSGWGQ